jgi:hypothetical protein
MKKIIILDFSTAKVHVFPYDENIYSDGEGFINNEWIEEEYGLGLKESQCQWMITDDLNIQIH